jgi:hypothetical protein
VKLSNGILLIGLSVAIITVSLLASPRLMQQWKSDDCMKTIRIYGPFQFDFNCDSNLFLILADNPSLLLKDKLYIAGQGRPLYPVIGWILSTPFRIFQFAPVAKYLSGLDGRWSIGFLPELMAFIFLNWLLMIASIAIFLRLIASDAVVFRVWEVLPATILLVNEITKYAFWTPHLQIFNIFMPVVSIYMFCRVLEKQNSLTWRQMCLIGLMIGLSSLIYGAFGVTAIGTIICILWGKERGTFKGDKLQRLKKCFLMGGSFLMPMISWYIFIGVATGTVYNHEIVKYRQFIWLKDSFLKGAPALMTDVSANIAAYLDTLLSVVAFPCLVLAVVIFLTRKLNTGNLRALYGDERWQAIVIYIVSNLSFYGLMGFYETRLSWTIVPAILVILGLTIRRLDGLLIGASRSVFHLFLTGTSSLYFAYWYLR